MCLNCRGFALWMKGECVFFTDMSYNNLGRMWDKVFWFSIFVVEVNLFLY